MKSLTLAALLSVAVLAGPAMAAPNTNAFQQSSEGQKAARAYQCQVMKDRLDIAEREADKRAGTAAAEPYSKAADQWWEAGVRNGCAWAR